LVRVNKRLFDTPPVIALSGLLKEMSRHVKTRAINTKHTICKCGGIFIKLVAEGRKIKTEDGKKCRMYLMAPHGPCPINDEATRELMETTL
jgi:hypothetical protein